MRALSWRAEPMSPASRIAIGGLVLLLHLGLVLAVLRLLQPRADSAETALQVVFVETVEQLSAPIPPWPVAPIRPAAATGRNTASRVNAPGSEQASASISAEAEQTSAPELFNPDGSVRLPDLPVEVLGWNDSQRIRLDRITALPGHSDAASVERVAIRLRRAMTPADVVGAVLRLLFGKVATDDCRTIEGRLSMSDPDVVREIDMVKYRKTCTP